MVDSCERSCKAKEFWTTFFNAKNMKKYKECISCERACYTGALKGLAKKNGITLERVNSVFCLEDRNYHAKNHVCNIFNERTEKLVE